MNHQHNIAIAQKLLEGIGSDRSPTEIAALFDAEVVFEIQGPDWMPITPKTGSLYSTPKHSLLQ